MVQILAPEAGRGCRKKGFITMKLNMQLLICLLMVRMARPEYCSEALLMVWGLCRTFPMIWQLCRTLPPGAVREGGVSWEMSRKRPPGVSRVGVIRRKTARLLYPSRICIAGREMMNTYDPLGGRISRRYAPLGDPIHQLFG